MRPAYPEQAQPNILQQEDIIIEDTRQPKILQQNMFLEIMGLPPMAFPKNPSLVQKMDLDEVDENIYPANAIPAGTSKPQTPVSKGPKLSQYELERLERIKKNNLKLEQLGLSKGVVPVKEPKTKVKIPSSPASG